MTSIGEIMPLTRNIRLFGRLIFLSIFRRIIKIYDLPVGNIFDIVSMSNIKIMIREIQRQISTGGGM